MDKTVVARLKLDISGYLASIGKGAAATKAFATELSGFGTTSQKHLQAVSRGALLMGGAVAAGLAVGVKAAMDWETAWAGVTKTVGAAAGETAEQTHSAMDQLEGDLRRLARTLPASHTEIAGVAEAAGQLGIQRSAIADFTETMIALGVSTNLSADEAATGIAQIENVMQTAQGDTDRFGATLVALGNVGASTESDILSMAQRLAGAGKLVGASESDVLGLANAMTSMGIHAELGGGAFSRVMLKIYSAVKTGGTAVKGFADVAGMSVADFTKKFQGDPISAIDDWIKGLNRIDQSGGNVVSTLSDLGFKGTQDRTVLLSLKGAGDLLTQSLDLGSKAWQENTALTNEAQKRYETTASRLRVLRNNVGDVAIDMGGVLLPAVKAATSGLSTFVAGVGSLNGAQRTWVVGIASVVGSATGLIGILGTVGPKVSNFVKGLESMGTIGAGIAGNLGAITGVLGLAGVALGVYTYVLGQNAKAQAEAEAGTRDLTTAIVDQGNAVGETTNKIMLDKLVKGDVGEALRNAGSDLTMFVGVMNDAGPAADRINEGLSNLSDGLRSPFLKSETDKWENFIALLDQGALKSAPALEAELRRLAASGEITTGGMARLTDRLHEQAEQHKQASIEAQNMTAAEKGADQAARAQATGAEKAARSTKEQAAAAQQATDAIKELIDAERAAIDPLFGMLDATKSNRDAQAELAKALNEGGHSASEISDLQLAAAKSALDFDAAATQLAGSIAAGTVNVDEAKQMLQGWVDAGLITTGVAKDMAAKFDEAATKVAPLTEDLKGSLTFTVDADTSAAEAKFNAFVSGLNFGVLNVGSITRLSAPAASAPKYNPKIRRFAGGGWAQDGQLTDGPVGADRIPALLSHGEYVLNAPAARAIGPRMLNQLNQGYASRWSGSSAQPGARFTGSQAAGTAVTSPVHVRVEAPVVSLHLGGGGSHTLEAALLQTMRKIVRVNGGDPVKVLRGI